MVKLKNYEVRFRGEFMLEGTNVFTLDHQSAMQEAVAMRRKIEGFKDTDYVVIEQGSKPYNKNWYLISKHNFLQRPHVKLDEKIIHPNDRDPQKRLAFAKACEATCRAFHPIPSSKFSDFNNQLEKYKKIHEAEKKEDLISKGSYSQRRIARIEKGNKKTVEAKKKDFVKFQKEYENHAIIKAAECQKECALAETAIINREKNAYQTANSNAHNYLSNAHNYLYDAIFLADTSHAWGTMSNIHNCWIDAKILAKKPRFAINKADKATEKARKQVAITNKKHLAFQKGGLENIKGLKTELTY